MRRRTVAIAVIALLLASACEGVVRYQFDQLRVAAGVAPVDTRSDAYLDATANDRARQRCSGPLATAPEVAYGGETAAAVAELSATAALDRAIAGDDEREYRATEALWAQWSVDPTLLDPDLTVGAVATVDCGDGTLAGVMALRQEPAMPTEGRFVSEQYTDDELEAHLDLPYATLIDHTGQIVELTLDIHAPPADGTERPAVVLFHGGGFSSGNKANRTGDAKAYARRGFVGITAAYRLRTSPVDHAAARADAITDGQAAIRWVEANAATYDIDAHRIVAAGTSVGGIIALGLATMDDGDEATGPGVAAALSTAAHLTPDLDSIVFDDDDAPALAFHHELDGDGWEYAHQTCAAMQAGGGTCDFIVQPGAGHTTSLSPNGPWWTAEIGPFLWHHLDLGAVAAPTPSEPFHRPTLVDADTLDAVVVEDWHVDEGAGTTRQKLIEIHVDHWWEGVEIRVPVRLIAPLEGPVSGFVVTGGSDPAARDHAPSDAEQIALAGGAGVVRTKIKPLHRYPGLPDANELSTRFVANLDARYTEQWLAATILMRSITAALADDLVEPGPVIAHGGGRSATASLLAAVHDDRITGVATTGSTDLHLVDRRQPVTEAGHLDHDIRAAETRIADDIDLTTALDAGLAAFAVQPARRPPGADPHVRTYAVPAVGRDAHPAAPDGADARAVFFAHHLFGASMGLESPSVDTQIIGSTIAVSVTFPDGGAPTDSRVFWRYDRGSFAIDDWAPMTGSGRSWTASIPVEAGHTSIDVVTTHTIAVDGRSAPISSALIRLEL